MKLCTDWVALPKQVLSLNSPLLGCPYRCQKCADKLKGKHLTDYWKTTAIAEGLELSNAHLDQILNWYDKATPACEYVPGVVEMENLALIRGINEPVVDEEEIEGGNFMGEADDRGVGTSSAAKEPKKTAKKGKTKEQTEKKEKKAKSKGKK